MENTVQGNWSNADGDWQLKRLQQDSVKTVEKIIEVVRETLQQDVMRIDREYEQMFGPSSAQFSEYLNMIMERMAQSGITSHGIIEWLGNAAANGTVADEKQAFARHMQSQTIPHIAGGITTKEALPVIQAEEALTYNPWQPDIPLVTKSAKNGSLAGAISGSYAGSAAAAAASTASQTNNSNSSNHSNFASPVISQFDEPLAPVQPVPPVPPVQPVTPVQVPPSMPAASQDSTNVPYSAYTAWGAPIPEAPKPNNIPSSMPLPTPTTPSTLTTLTPPAPVPKQNPVAPPVPAAPPAMAAPLAPTGGFQYQDPGHIPMPTMPALNNQLQVQIPLPQTYGNGHAPAMQNTQVQQQQPMPQVVQANQLQPQGQQQPQQGNLRNIPIPVGTGTAQAEAEREMARKKEESYSFDLSTAWD